MLKHLILYLCLLFLSVVAAYSQPDIGGVEFYSIKDGLSQNTVNCIFQDEKGYIWIGTQDGLNKFDGYSFKIYKKSLKRKHSLSNNTINAICKNTDNSIWIATQSGLCKYCYKTDNFEVFLNDSGNPNSLHTNRINALYQDNSGVLWIKSEQGIDKYDPLTNKFLHYRHPTDEFSYTSDYNNFTITEDSDENVWMGTKDGLVKFDKESEQFFEYIPGGDSNIDGREVFCVYIDKQNKLWIGTKKGLYIFDSKTGLFKVAYNELIDHVVTSVFQDSKGGYWIGTMKGLYYSSGINHDVISCRETQIKTQIANTRISSIIEDNSEILWVSSENGAFKIDLKGSKFELYRTKSEGAPKFSTNKIFSIFLLRKDVFLLGTRRLGLNMFNRATGEVTVFTTNNSGLSDNNIHCIKKDNNGRILLGTENGIFVFNKETNIITNFENALGIEFGARLQNNRVTDILHDNKNRYWIATYNGLLLIENKKISLFNNDVSQKNSIADNEVLQVIQRTNSEIWAATDKGLSCYLPSERKFKNFNNKNAGLSHYSVLSVYESKDKTLWAGTEFGLNRYIDTENRFEFFNSENSNFSNDFIYCILEDDYNNLWLSSNRGIIKFNTKTHEAENYFVDDGLQGYEFNIGSAYKNEKDGELFFGGANGFNAFYADSVFKNEYAPKVIFTGLEIFSSEGIIERVISSHKEISLEYNERSFKVYFSMPEYTHSKKNRYKCKIDGFNDWQDLGTANFFSVTQIPPGNYKFMVKAVNSDNVETIEVSELRIHILVPWWKSIWAYIVYGLSLVGLIILLIMFYNRAIRLENRVLNEKQKTAKKIEKQKEQLSIKNKNISDSIHYAGRIIEAMMPSDKFFKRMLPESFILLMPKDIVSGDFYWADVRDGIVFFAVVDCTGHGVPGAFMSIVGLNLLRDILTLGVENPAEILNIMNRGVTGIFESDDENAKIVKDGMDMTICAIDRKKKLLQFAGAKNSMYLMRDNQLIEHKGDRAAVGPGNPEDFTFTNHTIPLEDNDFIYLFSDGYADQFGGPKNKKFKYRRFRNVLLNIHKKNTFTQKKELKSTIMRWKGGSEQVDDILIVGVRPLHDDRQ